MKTTLVCLMPMAQALMSNRHNMFLVSILAQSGLNTANLAPC